MRLLAVGKQDLGKSSIEELKIELLNPLLLQHAADRLLDMHPGVSLYPVEGAVRPTRSSFWGSRSTVRTPMIVIENEHK